MSEEFESQDLSCDVDMPEVEASADHDGVAPMDDAMYEVPVESDSDDPQFKAIPSAEQKARGVAQMVGGAAIAVAGVPMLILPGPGALAIAGGVAMASKGHRDFTGREATAFEQSLDGASEKLGEVAKDGLGKASAKFDEVAPEPVKNAANAAGAAAGVAAEFVGSTASTVASAVSENAPKVGKAVTDFAGNVSEQAPVVGKQILDFGTEVANNAKTNAPFIAAQVKDFASNVADGVSKNAPEVGKKIIDFADIVGKTAFEAGKQAADNVRDFTKKKD